MLECVLKMCIFVHFVKGHYVLAGTIRPVFSLRVVIMMIIMKLIFYLMQSSMFGGEFCRGVTDLLSSVWWCFFFFFSLLRSVLPLNECISSIRPTIISSFRMDLTFNPFRIQDGFLIEVM